MVYNAKDSSKIEMTAKENIITITYTDAVEKTYTHTSDGHSFTLLGLELDSEGNYVTSDSSKVFATFV
jgi:hypothetical protein